MHRAMTDAIAKEVRHTLSDQTHLLRMLLLKKFRGQKLRITTKRRAFIDEVVAAVAAGRSTEDITLTSCRAIDLTFTDADVENLKQRCKKLLQKRPKLQCEPWSRPQVRQSSMALGPQPKNSAR
jgi:hypothetical protein